MSPAEEAVYRLLVLSGRVSAKDVALRTGLSQEKAARTLDVLIATGLASHTDETPRHFSAAPPDVALLPRLKRSAEALDLARIEAAQLIEAYQETRRRHDASQLLEVITGAEALRQQLRQIQNSAQHEMLWFCKAHYVAMPQAAMRKSSKRSRVASATARFMRRRSSMTKVPWTTS